MSTPARSRTNHTAVGGLAAGVALLALLSLGIGPVRLPPWQVLIALFGEGDEAARIIVRDIRLPRTILGVFVNFYSREFMIFTYGGI